MGKRCSSGTKRKVSRHVAASNGGRRLEFDRRQFRDGPCPSVKAVNGSVGSAGQSLPTARMSTPQPLLGILLVIGAASCFAVMDTTVRYIGAYFSVALVLWTRYALHAAIMTLWIVASKQRSFRSANPMFQIARGALLAFSSAMAFAALRRMPVAPV